MSAAGAIVSDEDSIACDAGVKHISHAHDADDDPVSCGTGSYSCPLCEWQIFVEIKAAK